MRAHPLASGMQAALAGAFAKPVATSIPGNIQQAVAHLVTHGSETCTLVALTNVAGAVADPAVMPELLAKQAGGVDFRSLYKKTTRPALLAVAANLGIHWKPSSDPYVSNPFREDKVDLQWVQRRLNKLPGADELRQVLEFVSGNRQLADEVLALLAGEQINRLSKAQVTYNLPPRLTTSFVSSLLGGWLEAGSNGARLEHVAIALLRFAGENVKDSWDEVVSHHVNDPLPYDALCTRRGEMVAIAECKDQPPTAEHILQLSSQMSSMGATRGFLFTRRNWIDASDQTEVNAAIQSRSVYGFRIDVIEVMEAVRTWLGLTDLRDNALLTFAETLINEMNENGRLEDRRDLAVAIDRKVVEG